MMPRALAASCAFAAVASWGSHARAEERKLTISQAVRLAVATDAELYIAREDAGIAAEGITLARSPFRPRLFAELFGRRDDAPPSPTSFGGVETTYGGELGLAGQLSTGLEYKVSAGFARTTRDDDISTVYDRSSATTVRAEIVQPLLRGAFAAARRPIVVATLKRDVSEQELRAQIERTVGSVEQAYWDYVRARAVYEARTAAVKLGAEQVEEAKRLKKLGTGTDHDIVEAEAGASRLQQELLRAEQEMLSSEGRLVDALGVRASDAGWGEGTIVPADPAELEPVDPDVEVYLAKARATRGEVQAAKLAIRAESEALDLAADRRSTALDLVASVGTVGFAGSLANSVATDGIDAGDPRFRSDSAYAGSSGKAFGNLGRDLHIFVGLRLEVLLGTHAADAQYATQRRALARSKLVERGALARVENEVRVAHARMLTADKLVKAADRSIVLAQALFDGIRKRFRNGAATSFDVVRGADELTKARVEAARARADYRAGLTALAVASGSVLESANITVKNLGPNPR